MDLIKNINDATREKDEFETAQAEVAKAEAEQAEAAGKSVQDYLTDIQSKEKE